MSSRLAAISLLITIGCSQSPVAPQDPPPSQEPTFKPQEPPDPVALGRAQAAIETLGQTLKGELMATMQADGPVAALGVCSQGAGSITASVASTSGVKVGRSSLRLRNPSNAGPPWVEAWLTQQGERSADGVEGHISAGQLDDGTTVVRVIAPLAVQPPCLTCHGPVQGRPAAITEILAASYPSDQANEYTPGELRGAIWAEAPVVDSGLVLELDGTAKWTLDDSTRAELAVIRMTANDPAPTDLAAAKAAAALIDEAVSRMIRGCTMEGASHDQLHHFLEALLPAIERLKGASTLPPARDAFFQIRGQVVAFDAHFE